MNELDDAFDVMTLIMALAIFTPIMVVCILPFMHGDVGGFNVQIEKTARETETEITSPPAETWSTDDILMMLAVADKYTPKPKKLRLNTGGTLQEISIDDNFLANKVEALQNAKLAMPSTVFVQMTLYSNSSGMRFWEVHP